MLAAVPDLPRVEPSLRLEPANGVRAESHPSPDPELREAPRDSADETRPDRNTAYPDTSYAGHGSRGGPLTLSRTDRVNRASAAVEVLIGVWLALSPWLVGSGGSSVLRWNDVAAGALLALLAAARLARPALPRTPTLSFGLGAWTIVAAFVLSFQNGNTGTAPLWNAIGCGAALTIAAAWSTTETERATLRRS